MKAFCFKCRQEIKIKYPREVMTRNGKPATEGLCSTCGHRVYAMGKAERQPFLALQ